MSLQSQALQPLIAGGCLQDLQLSWRSGARDVFGLRRKAPSGSKFSYMVYAGACLWAENSLTCQNKKYGSRCKDS